MTTQLLLRAALESVRQAEKDILAAMKPQYPIPEPPIDVIDKLPWNDKSPWPFPTRGKTASLTRVKYITIHHSAGKRKDTSISWWNNYHAKSKNWPHVGYHFGIAALERKGAINLYQLNRIGEHTWHDARNFDTVGVCIAGDLRAGKDTEPTPGQTQLTARLLAWLIPQLDNFIGVTFHKRIQATVCPGDVERWGEQIVQEVKKYGLDIGAQWGVKPTRTTRARLRGILKREPPMVAYEDV
jgi:hypothetical protein